MWENSARQQHPVKLLVVQVIHTQKVNINTQRNRQKFDINIA